MIYSPAARILLSVKKKNHFGRIRKHTCSFMSANILMAYYILYRIYYYCFLLRANKPTDAVTNLCDFSINEIARLYTRLYTYICIYVHDLFTTL